MVKKNFTLNCEFCLCTMFVLNWTLIATTVLLVGRKGRLEVLSQPDYLISYVSMTTIAASTVGLASLFSHGVWLGDDFSCASATFVWSERDYCFIFLVEFEFLRRLLSL
ncbi:hypothetical protein Fcan01_23059 [Folsomia candida]|uniref:Uncharacterized protein n=1 Tax=Folsomia candida TaxID=158441 RepID=A0A226DAE4_FOLCA|nr:hypothetical protein Fcan01_23059 [Folsomia candida]